MQAANINLFMLPIKGGVDSRFGVNSRIRLIPKSAILSCKHELTRQLDDFKRPWHLIELW